MAPFHRRASRQQPAGAPSGVIPPGPPVPGAPEAPGARETPPPSAMLTIDALGRKCPIPILMLAERMHEVPIGGIIAVLADDPAAKTDLPAWCRMKSHDFVSMADFPPGWSFFIRRSY